MGAKHTPGPWTYDPSGDCDGELIGTDHFVMAGDRELACPPTEADARLMAAAPDLLAACQAIRDADEEAVPGALELVCSAIAKATDTA